MGGKLSDRGACHQLSRPAQSIRVIDLRAGEGLLWMAIPAIKWSLNFRSKRDNVSLMMTISYADHSPFCTSGNRECRIRR